MGYTRDDVAQNFLWGIGYKSYRPGGVGPPWQILSGISEYSRTHGPGVTPEGYFQKTSSHMITDLPLAPTKPIDFGLLEWCGTCGKCAEMCPVGAIPTRDEMKEPTWQRATGIWSASNDHKGYPNDSDKCWTWWAENIVGGFYPLPAYQCSYCTNACPFTKQHSSWLHDISKAVVSTTPIFNSFLLALDDFAGYGGYATQEEIDAFWTEPMGAFGLEEVVRDY
jgi:reductive dehalogenase